MKVTFKDELFVCLHVSNNQSMSYNWDYLHCIIHLPHQIEPSVIVVHIQPATSHPQSHSFALKILLVYAASVSILTLNLRDISLM